MSARRLAAVPDEWVQGAAYVRVSKEREEMISPVLQRASVDDHAERAHIRLVETIEDLDRTGRNFARAGIQRILTGVEDGRWQTVLVYRYDRFGRNVRDSLVNIARVEQAGGRVVSATEPFDATTAIGKYGRTNILAVAELQSDLIGEQWKQTHQHRRSRGLPHGGGVRLGYLYDKREGYSPDPELAPVVMELYRRYLAGDGYRPLSDWLAHRAIVSPRTGGAWTPRGVAYYLDCGFAAGLLRVGGAYQQGAHPPLIDVKTWASYLRERKRRGDVPARILAPTTVLAGMVRCNGCTYAMRSKTDRRYGRGYLYVCETHGCPRPVTVTRTRVEQAVRTWLEPLAFGVAAGAAAKSASKADKALAHGEVVRLRRDANRLTEQLTRLTVKLASEVIGDEEYSAARAELLATRDLVGAELEKAQVRQEQPLPSPAVVRGLLNDWETLPVVASQRILRDVLQCVLVTKQNGKRSLLRPYGVWEQLP
jgi:site-specific DNA recombinase